MLTSCKLKLSLILSKLVIPSQGNYSMIQLKYNYKSVCKWNCYLQIFFPAKQVYGWGTTLLNAIWDAEGFPERPWMRTAGNDSSLLYTQVSKVSSCSLQWLFLMNQRNEQNLSLLFLIDFRQFTGRILLTMSTKYQRNVVLSQSAHTQR